MREINKINDLELKLGSSSASWHDEYKDSAYIYVGGLHFDLTEGDVITIFSQYGEVMDVNMPRDKDTGKTKGFGFLMYEDQRSTVLAVDNLNGAKVLEKILRVDHVKQYKQTKHKNEEGEWVEAEEQSLNARPELINDDGADSDGSSSSGASIDPEDPMYEYLVAQRREEKAASKGKKLKKSKKSKQEKKSKRANETPEERRARKERKREKRDKTATKKDSEGVKGVQDLLDNLMSRPARSRSRTPPFNEHRRDRRRSRSASPRRDSYSRRRDSPDDDLSSRARSSRR